MLFHISGSPSPPHGSARLDGRFNLWLVALIIPEGLRAIKHNTPLAQLRDLVISRQGDKAVKGPVFVMKWRIPNEPLNANR